MQLGRGEWKRERRTEMSLLDLLFNALGFVINELTVDEYVDPAWRDRVGISKEVGGCCSRLAK